MDLTSETRKASPPGHLEAGSAWTCFDSKNPLEGWDQSFSPGSLTSLRHTGGRGWRKCTGHSGGEQAQPFWPSLLVQALSSSSDNFPITGVSQDDRIPTSEYITKERIHVITGLPKSNSWINLPIKTYKGHQQSAAFL